jgi:ribosomal protein S27E
VTKELILREGVIPTFLDQYLMVGNDFTIGCYECKNSTELVVTFGMTRGDKIVYVTCAICGQTLAKTEGAWE